jgi:RHS repeat-associated protein
MWKRLLASDFESDYIYIFGTNRPRKRSGTNMKSIGGRNTDGELGNMGQVNCWNNDLLMMNFAYKCGTRYYLLGGKEIRVGDDGAIRSVIYPSFAGAGRTTLNVAQNKLTTEFSSLDYLGSTTRVNKFENGAWAQTLSTEYDVWGREIQMVQSGGEEYDDRFTGKKKDVELGLDYFGWRFLDKDFGTWISRDKAGEFWNPYSYMENSRNPLNVLDILGLNSNKPINLNPVL